MGFRHPTDPTYAGRGISAGRGKLAIVSTLSTAERDTPRIRFQNMKNVASLEKNLNKK